MSVVHQIRGGRRGAVLVLAMVFLVMFSALAAGLGAMSGMSVQMSSNQHKANGALHAAQSGLECAQYLVKTVTGLARTSTKTVSDTQANQTWASLCSHVETTRLDGKTVPAAGRFTDALGDGDELVTPALRTSVVGEVFTIRFYRYDADPRTIKIQSTGTDGTASRQISLNVAVTKDREVLDYAVAGRGRLWLTGNTTVHGNLFSTWNRRGISPFNTTSDTTVEGTIGTVRTLEQIEGDTYQLETLNADGLPIDCGGNPLDTNYEDRYHGPHDQIQGYHEGINYGQPNSDMPGLSIADYDTDSYATGLTALATSSTRCTEYFPHAAGHYDQPRDGGSTSFSRHVYENQAYSNVRVPQNRHALFRNCTFQDVLYIDCSKTSASKSNANNVRFEDCTFNGVIVTRTPQPFNWINNCLYFTGEATFDNQSAIQEATILAPHFNVNLGNTNPDQSDNNVLTGAIVGGIVDIRGNAQIYGTIISMFDTSGYTSGYVTNIGATLGDGGTETTDVGDVGVITITPEQDKMLPSGITSPIIIKPDPTTYSEV